MFPYKKNKNHFYRSVRPDSLLPSQKIIKFVQYFGVDLGSKNPQTKIYYFWRLGLFEDLVSKTPKNTDFKSNSQSRFKLPYSTVDRIVQIETLHKNGLSYRKIVNVFKNISLTKITINAKPEMAYKLPGTNSPRYSASEYKLERPKLANIKDLGTPDDLISTRDLIEIAQNLGVDLGKSNQKERIRYFIKLGILPQTVKKSSYEGKIVGHLPSWALERLLYVDRLYARGLSYPKIAQKLKRIRARRNKYNENQQKVIFYILEHQLNKKFRHYQKNIEKIVSNKLDQYFQSYRKDFQNFLGQKIPSS